MSTAASLPAAAPPPVAFVKPDFPGWLPPMLVKELRQGLRTRGFVGALVAFQVIMVFLMVGALAVQATQTSAARAAGAAVTSGFFWTILGVQLLIVTPSRALGGLQLEVESRTLDLLVLTRLSAWRIVLGKWISLVAQASLLLIAMLPYLVVRYFTENADIVADAGRCLALLGFSAVLTAAGLWASGIAKVLRVVLVILFVFSLQGLGGAFGPRLFGIRMGGAAGNPFLQLIQSPVMLFDAVLITAFFLISAVRNIAPPAENHSFFTRILPVLALLAAPFAQIAGAHTVAANQVMFSAAFLAFVLLFELGVGRAPMPSHWRAWRQRGGYARATGYCALPGWPSAMLFGLLAVGLWVLIASFVLMSGPGNARVLGEKVGWFALLGFSSLVFPAVLQSLLRAVPASPVVLYFAGLGFPLMLSFLAAWLAEGSTLRFTGLRSFMETMPVGNFIFATTRRYQADEVMIIAGIVAAVVILGGLWRSRPYWHQLKLFEARDRAAEPLATK